MLAIVSLGGEVVPDARVAVPVNVTAAVVECRDDATALADAVRAVAPDPERAVRSHAIGRDPETRRVALAMVRGESC